MKSFAMTLNLKEEAGVVDKYKEYHRAAWPEVLAALRGIGISKLKIFLHGRRLFMYLEASDAFDPGRDLPRYVTTERVREWDDLMATFQEPVPGAAPGEWWADMEEVFDIDW